jgi:hypothetical protein
VRVALPGPHSVDLRDPGSLGYDNDYESLGVEEHDNDAWKRMMEWVDRGTTNLKRRIMPFLC